MKQKIIITIICFISFNVFGQKSNLIEFLPSTCDFNEDVLRIRERISELYFQHDTLVINVGFVANCGFSESPIKADAIFKEDTLYLTYAFKHKFMDTIAVGIDTIIYLSMNYAACDCCFEFKYLIKGISSTRIPIKLNNKIINYHPEKYKTYPVEFETFKGDTINYIDKYGFRQGLWVVRDKNGLIIFDRLYRNDTIVNGIDYRYYENGKIKAKLEWIENEYNNYYEYDKEGNIIKHKRSPLED